MRDFDSRFRGWLLRETGIDPDSLGNDFLIRAVTERVHAVLAADGERLPSSVRPPVTPEALDAYWQRLNGCADERRALIELFVVPETWFFRDREAFATVARLAVQRVAASPSRVVRVLSAPCSTGEEPYSVAMALLDAGLEPDDFAIDAIDLSARAIEHARVGSYGRNAFRGTSTEFRARYFTPVADGWLLDERVRACVQFRQANLVEPLSDTGIRYDFVFCRNVLIYFDREVQDRVIRSLDACMTEDGMLFVGPAETGVAMRHGMRSARIPLAFAFHRERSGAAADGCATRRATPMPAAAPYRRAERFAPRRRPGAGRRRSRSRRRSHRSAAWRPCMRPMSTRRWRTGRPPPARVRRTCLRRRGRSRRCPSPTRRPTTRTRRRSRMRRPSRMQARSTRPSACSRSFRRASARMRTRSTCSG